MQLQNDANKARELYLGASGFVQPDRPLTMDEYARLVNLCSDRLNLPRDSVWSCGNVLTHQNADQQLIYKFCYYLTVNKVTLKRQILVMNGGSFQEEVVIVRFLSMAYLPGGQIMARTQIMTGSAALECFNLKGYKGDWVTWLRQLGYSHSASDYYISSLKACIPGLYAKIKMTAPSPSKIGMLDDYLIELVKSPSIEAFNRKEIISYRRCLKECPLGLLEEQSCEDDYCGLRCVHGWDKCIASGHELECVRDLCPCCGHDGLIPVGGDRCLRCKRNDKGEEDYD